MEFSQDRVKLTGAGKAETGLFGIATQSEHDRTPDYLEVSFADALKLRAALDAYISQTPTTVPPTAPATDDPFNGEPHCT